MADSQEHKNTPVWTCVELCSALVGKCWNWEELHLTLLTLFDPCLMPLAMLGAGMASKIWNFARKLKNIPHDHSIHHPEWP